MVNGGAPVTGYRLQVSWDGRRWTSWSDRGYTSPGGPHPITNVWAIITANDIMGDYAVPGRRLWVRVAAINAAGTGPFTLLGSAIPYGPPGKPRNFTVAAYTRSAVIRWQAPVSNGGRPITAYVVRVSVPGTNFWRTVKVTSTTSVTLGGLLPGYTYCYTVHAVTSAGAGYLDGHAFATAGAVPEPEGRCWRQLLVYDPYVRAVARVKAIWAV